MRFVSRQEDRGGREMHSPLYTICISSCGPQFILIIVIIVIVIRAPVAGPSWSSGGCPIVRAESLSLFDLLL